MEPKKVFVSYAWEDEVFAKKILEFANRLRENGIDANIDQYEENPDMGWPIWMENQIENSDYVLIVATKTYLEKFKQQQEGKGVSWEIGSIYQSLYNLKGHNDKFIPIVFDNEDIKYIVKALQPYTHYNISSNFMKLVNRIKGIPNVEKPPIRTNPLPRKERKSLFVSNPINIEAWNEAKWSGVCFLNIEGCWLIGLVFKGNKDSVLKIFEEWQDYPNLDDYIYVSFIEGEIEKLPPNGYTCLISPNFEKTLERSRLFATGDEQLILLCSRFQRMYPTDNFCGFNYFKSLVLSHKGEKIPIMPITLKDKRKGLNVNNLVLHYDKIIATKNIKYLQASEINRDHYASCCIPKFNKNFPLKD